MLRRDLSRFDREIAVHFPLLEESPQVDSDSPKMVYFGVMEIGVIKNERQLTQALKRMRELVRDMQSLSADFLIGSAPVEMMPA